MKNDVRVWLRGARVCVVALTLILAACGDDDASADAGAIDGGAPVAPPSPPATPTLTPCPTGWREVRRLDDAPACEPWPDSGRAVCSGDEAHFAGEAGCRLVSRPCPTDGWPADLPAPAAGGATRYVSAAASAGGDGSRATPFTTINAALSGAAAGDVVAIGEGVYDEIVVVREAVSLIGACAERSVLAGPVAPSGRGRLDIDARDVVVRDLGVHGRGLGIWISAGASASIEGVVVRDVDVGGFVVLGTAALRDVLIRDVGPGPGGTFGRGLHAEGGARVDATRLVVERARELGVSFGRGGTSAHLEDLVVSETLGEERDDILGVGVVVFGGARVELARAVIEHSRFIGLNAGEAGTVVVATDLVVRDTEAQTTDGVGGNALLAGGGASIEVQRGLLERDHGAEASALGDGTTVRLDDCVLRDTRPRASDGMFGAGVVATQGGAITLRRVEISRVAAVGAMADGAGCALDAEDLAIADVAAQADGTNGAGVVVSRGARLRLLRTGVTRAGLVGISAAGATVSTLEDVAISNIESQPANGRFGFGLEVDEGGVLDATRLDISDTRGVALSAFTGGTLRASEVSVRRTRAMACADGACVGNGAGIGVLSRGGSVTLSRFVIADGALCGVQIADGGSLDLMSGEIARNPIGASVLVDGFDFTRIATGVVFVGNERNIDSMSLPVPDPALPMLVP